MRLGVVVREPLKANDKVIVVARPWRESSKDSALYKKAKDSGSWPPHICLFKEQLSSESASRLHVALTIIKDMQGLDFREGLALMTQVYLIAKDFFVRRQGFPSVLSGQVQRVILGQTDDPLLRRLVMNMRMWPVGDLLDFWATYGGVLSKGFVHRPDEVSGRPTYLRIPPCWIPDDHGEGTRRAIHIQGPMEVQLDESLLDVISRLPELQVRLEEPLTINVFLKQGDDWLYAYDGICRLLRDAIGPRYIAFLLKHPGRQFRITELVFAIKGQYVSPAVEIYNGMSRDELAEYDLSKLDDLGDAGDVLDEQALAEYESELKKLGQELQRALDEGDTALVETLRRDEHLIKQQIEAGRGYGARVRKAADAVEKARKAVSKSVNATLKKIRKEHPSLGLHLSRWIHIGKSCSYEPDKDTPWIV